MPTPRTRRREATRVGWSVYTAAEIGVTFRDGAVENTAEIHAAFDDNPQPRLTCAYCGARSRQRNRDSAIRWYLGHDCDCA